MTIRFGGLFGLSRLNLGPKAALSAALLITLNAAFLVGAGYWSLTRDFNTRAVRDIDLSLRTLTLAFGEAYPDTRITIRDGVVERVEVPKMPEFTDHRIVDRAVGTQLAADHPGQAVLRRGQAYKGPAMLFGRRFYTAYHPVFDPAGKVVGIIYVGIAMDELDGMLWQGIFRMGIR